jgi:hypothetical protein
MTHAVPHAAPTGSTRRRLALFALLALLVGVIPVARAVRAAAADPVVPLYTVTVSDANPIETNSGQRTATFTLTLSPPALETVTVNYETSDPVWSSGTVDAVATAGTDYLSKVGTVTFAATNTTKSVSVTVLGDTAPEPNESFDLVAEVDGVDDTPGRGTGTIVNDDAAAPTIAIADVQQSEGDTGSTTFGFTVTRTGNTSQPVTFRWGTEDDSSGANPADSGAGGDYSPVADAIDTIGAGLTSTVVNVTVARDLAVEMNETFNVVIKQVQNAGVSDSTATGTILDDDEPALTFTDPIEGDDPNTTSQTGTSTNPNLEGETTRTFTVDFADTTKPSGRTVTVDYTTANGTATAPGDYTAKIGTLTFAPGETTKDIVVSIHEDTTPEANEEFYVTLSNPGNAVLGQNPTATGRIVEDDDADPTFDISKPTVTEPDTGTVNADFVVTLSSPSGETVTADYATADGTATQPADYTLTTGTLTFTPGQTSKTVTVPVKGDTAAEGNEKFNLQLSNLVNAGNCADPSACGTATINDDETVTVSVIDAAIDEADAPTTATMPVSVVLSTAVGQPVDVLFHTENGSAKSGEDYTEQPDGTTVTIPAGQTSVDIEIDITSDNFGEPTETFTVVLESSDVATIADGTAVAEITDDDSGVPTVSIADASNDESGDVVFDVTLSPDTPRNPGNTDVHYTVTPGGATSADGVEPETGTVTFRFSETGKKTITVTVVDDTVDEPSETFTVTLSDPSNAAIDDGEATGTITDNDGPTVTIDDVSRTEGNTGTTNAVFTVSLTGPSVEAFDVNYTTADTTAEDETGDSDYTATTGKLTFPANSAASQTISVPVVGDTDDEPNEAFKVTLTLPDDDKADLGDAEGVGTIIDDDGPAITIADAAAVTEGLSGTTNATFNVTLSVGSGQVVTVDYTTVDDTATAPSDYTTTTGTVTFPANSTAQSINVPVKGDNVDEDTETFKVVLSNATNANIADGEGMGTINDDDAAPAMSIGDQQVTEGDNSAVPVTLTVTLSRASSKTVTANYSTVDNTATAPADYTAKSGTVSFAPGETAKGVTVLVAGDTADESNETFFVDLATAANATILDARGVATIADNDDVSEPQQGYWLTASDAGIFSFGDSTFHGSKGGQPLNEPIVGMASTETGNGYWQVASDGGIFSWGDATFFGSKGGQPLNEPVVGMASTPDGNGYWLVASDGGIFTFGNAGFYGSKGGQPLNEPIVGMASTPSGRGYWLVARDGGIFSFGDATFYGSKGGQSLNEPIVGMAATPNGGGYWLVASDGGIFTFGNAGFYGSAAGFELEAPIVGMARTPSGGGYWLVGADGEVFAGGDAEPLGSMGGQPLNAPIVGMAAHPG